LSEGQVRSTDRRAVFVGASAYEKAGGSIIRDLFDSEGGGFFADAELLNRLAGEKLQAFADKVAAEGWRWVVAALEFDHEGAAGMRRVFARPLPLSKTQRERLCKLQSRYDALCEKHQHDEMPAKAARAALSFFARRRSANSMRITDAARRHDPAFCLRYRSCDESTRMAKMLHRTR
jgi:ParB family chromosome partitioning protein